MDNKEVYRPKDAEIKRYEGPIVSDLALMSNRLPTPQQPAPVKEDDRRFFSQIAQYSSRRV